MLFEDLESASNAVDTMDNECVGGKEVRVKRARGFYIRMEAEARRKAAQKQRDREMLGAVVQHEIASRLKVAEEEHFASLDHKVGGHMRTFDVVTTKREILRDITQEALNTQQPRRRASSPEEFKKMMGQERQNFDQVRGQIEDETEAYQAKASMIEDEERIRKQAMMEIMVEGDKLSKAARGQSNDKTINMARLIRERMDQIKRLFVQPRLDCLVASANRPVFSPSPSPTPSPFINQSIYLSLFLYTSLSLSPPPSLLCPL